MLSTGSLQADESSMVKDHEQCTLPPSRPPCGSGVWQPGCPTLLGVPKMQLAFSYSSAVERLW